MASLFKSSNETDIGSSMTLTSFFCLCPDSTGQVLLIHRHWIELRKIIVVKVGSTPGLLSTTAPVHRDMSERIEPRF
ncbi:hypothetical protein WG66_000518 [Moniliophthora roreri]|nr:hypothetical protein WG66_000518 [Moniliophthora roreri]